jgi:hypothetical protein
VTVFSWVLPGGTPTTSTNQNPGDVAFSKPGTYVASLTVADNLGVNDPSPPTRTISVVAATNPTLTVTKQGTGTGTVTSSPAGITCGADCSEAYASGTVVTLTPTAAAGSTFGGWSGAADCSDGVVTVTQNTTCTATFTAARPILRVSKSGNGSGTITSNPVGISCGADCSEAYDFGTVVSLTATPAPGHKFEGWTGDADCGDGQVTMNTDKSCKARFRR